MNALRILVLLLGGAAAVPDVKKMWAQMSPDLKNTTEATN